MDELGVAPQSQKALPQSVLQNLWSGVQEPKVRYIRVGK